MHRYLCLFLISVLISSTTPAQAAKSDTGYDRVIKTQTLRCGYGTWEPGVYKDPKTGKMTGLFVDLINEIGRLSKIQIEWTAEIDWGQIVEAIRSGKIDAFCAGMTNDAVRGKYLAYSHPLSYWTFDVLVRAEDNRFPQSGIVLIGDLNKKEYKTAYSEGDVLETIAINEFPLVKGVPLPPMGTPADNLMNVLTKKTDFVVFPKVMFQGYSKTNPGKLRYLKVEPPLRRYGNVIAMGIDDLRLQQLVNAGVIELVNSGAYHTIMQKYDIDYPGAFIPASSTTTK
ncbi:MAG: transporter substrate-binding domain-containing protein [Proteobacteria bacterium]|jgi:ABC-type amino acid transport substrate-binding protein|nr:transporter substrate-binding domain-containing protein [Alphaproteobacteria bacterium]NCC03176.1 transporter substrate-binding domain-containing protein [Pseudomonadota bacterium]